MLEVDRTQFVRATGSRVLRRFDGLGCIFRGEGAEIRIKFMEITDLTLNCTTRFTRRVPPNVCILSIEALGYGAMLSKGTAVEF